MTEASAYTSALEDIQAEMTVSACHRQELWDLDGLFVGWSRLSLVS